MERKLSEIQTDSTRLTFFQNTHWQPHSSIQDTPNKNFGKIIGGKNYSMAKIFHLLDLMIPTQVGVSLIGESGTGKDLFAQTLHQFGPLSAKPFVKVDCASLADGVLESHLFGHKKGSFTGAVVDHEGLLSQANGGSLFLDTIGEMSLDLQKKILHVLERKEFRPLGSKEITSVQFRIIISSQIDLEKLVEEGKFREDLFYRLNVASFHLPPLRQRREDILLLVNYFSQQFAQTLDVAKKEFSQRALKTFYFAPWPGNVRQLANTLEKIYTFHSKKHLDLKDLPPEFRRNPQDTLALSFEASKTQYMKHYLKDLLEATNGNISQAAKRAGVTRRALYKQIEKYR
jgi:two-component system response regulator GlrR